MVIHYVMKVCKRISTLLENKKKTRNTKKYSFFVVIIVLSYKIFGKEIATL